MGQINTLRGSTMWIQSDSRGVKYIWSCRPDEGLWTSLWAKSGLMRASAQSQSGGLLHAAHSPCWPICAACSVYWSHSRTFTACGGWTGPTAQNAGCMQCHANLALCAVSSPAQSRLVPKPAHRVAQPCTWHAAHILDWPPVPYPVSSSARAPDQVSKGQSEIPQPYVWHPWPIAFLVGGSNYW